jgi:hypothetical protein
MLYFFFYQNRNMFLDLQASFLFFHQLYVWFSALCMISVICPIHYMSSSISSACSNSAHFVCLNFDVQKVSIICRHILFHKYVFHEDHVTSIHGIVVLYLKKKKQPILGLWMSVRPKKNIGLFKVSRPTLFFTPRPWKFLWNLSQKKKNHIFYLYFWWS